MWIKYNANPVANMTEDCAIRAVAVALDISWDDAFDQIARMAKSMGEVMHLNAAFGAVLRSHGFTRHIIPNRCPDCYTVADFCRDHPEGIYVLVCGSHAVACISGNWIDTWDSSAQIPIYYWEDNNNGI